MPAVSFPLAPTSARESPIEPPIRSRFADMLAHPGRAVRSQYGKLCTQAHRSFETHSAGTPLPRVDINVAAMCLPTTFAPAYIER